MSQKHAAETWTGEWDSASADESEAPDMLDLTADERLGLAELADSEAARHYVAARRNTGKGRVRQAKLALICRIAARALRSEP